MHGGLNMNRGSKMLEMAKAAQEKSKRNMGKILYTIKNVNFFFYYEYFTYYFILITGVKPKVIRQGNGEPHPVMENISLVPGMFYTILYKICTYTVLYATKTKYQFLYKIF